MPYIKQHKRDMLDSTIDHLHKILVDLEIDDENNNMEGNLNYTITRLLRMCYGESYKDINDVVGLLNCVILEHYRTVAAPHEEQAKFDNGDVNSDIGSILLNEVLVEKEDDTTGC